MAGSGPAVRPVSRRRTGALLGALVLLVWALPVVGSAAAGYRLPVAGARLLRGFEPPAGPYGSGHRGVDLGGSAGSAVVAASDGLVVFAGTVAGSLAVTLAHAEGVRTTYTYLSDVRVGQGTRVAAGTALGGVGPLHLGQSGRVGVHWGARRGDIYFDPLELLDANLAGRLRLVPLGPTTSRLAVPSAQDGGLGSSEDTSAPTVLPQGPPNDNLLVFVPGIDTSSDSPAGFDPAALGYPSGRAFFAGYGGARSQSSIAPVAGSPEAFRAPFGREDSWAGVARGAAALLDQLRAIHAAHPEAAVDIVAHSQGGLVARYALMLAGATNPDLPRVAHLVTLATPHGGADLAELVLRVQRLDWGRLLVAAVLAAGRSAGLTHLVPGAASFADLAPGSGVLAMLGYAAPPGVATTTIAGSRDPVVPLTRAWLAGAESYVVQASHGSILRDPQAMAIVWGALADDPVPHALFESLPGLLEGVLVGNVESGLFDQSPGVAPRNPRG
ncbi:MAG: peptidoglycan DD-metalloendopeptidase family protein [Actinomycetota bacterium]